MKSFMLYTLAAGLIAPLSFQVQEPPTPAAEHPAHQELRAVRDQLIEAFNKNDFDGLLKHVHPNAVLTWQDAEISRGHQGLRTYYDRMMKGPNRVVESVTATVTVDELTILYGDTSGLAFGRVDQDFKLTNGTQLHLLSRWTAHVVKEDDHWLVSGLHVSANVFDNAILHMAVKQTALWTGGIALVVGIVLGLVVPRVIARLRRKQVVR